MLWLGVRVCCVAVAGFSRGPCPCDLEPGLQVAVHKLKPHCAPQQHMFFFSFCFWLRFIILKFTQRRRHESNMLLSKSCYDKHCWAVCGCLRSSTAPFLNRPKTPRARFKKQPQNPEIPRNVQHWSAPPVWSQSRDPFVSSSANTRPHPRPPLPLLSPKPCI